MSIYEYNEEYVKKSLLEEGREEGMESALLTSICNLMKSMHWTLEQSMSALLIPKNKQSAYKKMLEK